MLSPSSGYGYLVSSRGNVLLRMLPVPYAMSGPLALPGALGLQVCCVWYGLETVATPGFVPVARYWSCHWERSGGSINWMLFVGTNVTSRCRPRDPRYPADTTQLRPMLFSQNAFHCSTQQIGREHG